MSHSASTKKAPRKAPQPVDPLVRDLRGYLLTERKRSPLTVAAYERDLMEFGEFLRATQDGAPLLAVKPTQIRQYIAHMFDGRGYDSRTVCRKLSSIRALYRFLKITGVLENDPAAAIPGPSVSKKRPAPLKVDEVIELLRTSLAGQTGEARLRDGAIMELFYASGMRRAEVAGVRLADVDLAERTIRVTGKGNKERTVVINRTSAAAIEAYLRVRPQSADPCLFLGPRRQGADAQTRVADLSRDLSHQRHSETCLAAYAAPLVRHPSRRERRGPRNRPRAARARELGYDGRLPAAGDGP